MSEQSITKQSNTEVKKTRSELKREAIIAGAMKAFQQYGVADSSMDKIAELANVSKRTVYNHFESKEMLVAEIITSEWEKHTVVYNLDYNPSKSIESQLTLLAANELELMCNSKLLELIRVAMAHLLFAPDFSNAQLARIFEQETALKRWLKLAMADGKLKESNVALADEQITGLLKARAFWPQVMRQEKPLTEKDKKALIEVTVGMFLSYYKV